MTRLVSALLPLLLLALSAQAAPWERCSYVRTVDGDTVRVELPSGEVAVRLFGVDCPELRGGTAAAFEAAAFTARELEAADDVRLELDQACLHDDHGRTLAWVWYHRGGHWLLLNEELIAAGHAEVYERCQSKRYMPRIKAACVP